MEQLGNRLLVGNLETVQEWVKAVFKPEELVVFEDLNKAEAFGEYLGLCKLKTTRCSVLLAALPDKKNQIKLLKTVEESRSDSPFLLYVVSRLEMVIDPLKSRLLTVLFRQEKYTPTQEFEVVESLINGVSGSRIKELWGERKTFDMGAIDKAFDLIFTSISPMRTDRAVLLYNVFKDCRSVPEFFMRVIWGLSG
jgi:hypothetical protein